MAYEECVFICKMSFNYIVWIIKPEGIAYLAGQIALQKSKERINIAAIKDDLKRHNPDRRWY